MYIYIVRRCCRSALCKVAFLTVRKGSFWHFQPPQDLHCLSPHGHAHLSKLAMHVFMSKLRGGFRGSSGACVWVVDQTEDSWTPKSGECSPMSCQASAWSGGVWGAPSNPESRGHAGIETMLSISPTITIVDADTGKRQHKNRLNVFTEYIPPQCQERISEASNPGPLRLLPFQRRQTLATKGLVRRLSCPECFFHGYFLFR